MVKMPFEKKHIDSHKKAVDVNKLIDKGAPVKNDRLDESKKWACVNLRFPSALLQEIDEFVEGLVGTSRTGWILQTLQKELRRTNKKDFSSNSKDDE